MATVISTMSEFTSYKDNYADMIAKRNDIDLTAELLVKEYISDFYYDRPGYSISPGTIGFIQLEGEQSPALPNLAGTIFESVRTWLFFDEYYKQKGDTKKVTEINKTISKNPLYGGYNPIQKIFKELDIEFNGIGYIKLDDSRLPMLSQNQFIFLNGISIIASIAPLFFLKGYGDDQDHVDEFTDMYTNIVNIIAALVSTKWVNYIDKEEIESHLQTVVVLLKKYCTATIEDPELWDPNEELTWDKVKDDAKLINSITVSGIDKIDGLKETIETIIKKAMNDNAIGNKIPYFPETIKQNIFVIQQQYIGPIAEIIESVMKDMNLIQVIDGYIRHEDMGQYKAYATDDRKIEYYTDAMLSRNGFDKNHPIVTSSTTAIVNNVRVMSGMHVQKPIVDKVYVDNDVYYGVSGITPIPEGLTDIELIDELKASIRRLI